MEHVGDDNTSLERREGGSKYQLLMEQASDGIAIYDLRGNIMEANLRACEMLGYTREEMLNLNLTQIILPEDLDKTPIRFAELRTGKIVVSERMLVRKDGTRLPVEVSARLLDDSDGVQAIVRDITERKRFEAQLAYQAFHDSLTGLPNRMLFIERLTQALNRKGKRGRSVAVFFLDLDNFKVINDTLGHHAGDLILIEVGERIQKCLRLSDSIARLGGDEYTILLEGIEEVEALKGVAERIAEQLSIPFHVGEREVYVSASIGIARGASGREYADALLRNADTAMYRAKKARVGYKLFDPSMISRAALRSQAETELGRAIENGELRIHYQPVVDLVTGRIVEIEALVRWQHPQYGLVLPQEFIPLAEETELIERVGKWVLEQACRQVKAWQMKRQDDPLLALSVNVSIKQLRHPEFVVDIKASLDRSGLDPRSLKLEVSDGAALDDIQPARDVFHELKQMGIHLSLDNFGISGSVLGNVARYAISGLKLDRSFVNGLGHSAEDAAIVRAMLAFAAALGMTVTAKGIETSEQLAFLRSLGCEYGQGYYFAPALPAESLEILLTRPFDSATGFGDIVRLSHAQSIV